MEGTVSSLLADSAGNVVGVSYKHNKADRTQVGHYFTIDLAMLKLQGNTGGYSWLPPKSLRPPGKKHHSNMGGAKYMDVHAI